MNPCGSHSPPLAAFIARVSETDVLLTTGRRLAHLYNTPPLGAGILYFPALADPASGGRAVVADDLAPEAGQDRRPDRAVWPPRCLSTRRSGGVAGAVRRDPAPDRPIARTAKSSGLKEADH